MSLLVVVGLMTSHDVARVLEIRHIWAKTHHRKPEGPDVWCLLFSETSQCRIIVKGRFLDPAMTRFIAAKHW